MKLRNNKLVNTLLSLGAAYQLMTTFDVAKADSFVRTKGGTIETISEYGAVIATDDKTGFYTVIADVDKDGEIDFSIFGRVNEDAKLIMYKNTGIEEYKLNKDGIQPLNNRDDAKVMLGNVNKALDSIDIVDWFKRIQIRKADFQYECQEARKLNRQIYGE